MFQVSNHNAIFVVSIAQEVVLDTTMEFVKVGNAGKFHSAIYHKLLRAIVNLKSYLLISCFLIGVSNFLFPMSIELNILFGVLHLIVFERIQWALCF